MVISRRMKLLKCSLKQVAPFLFFVFGHQKKQLSRCFMCLFYTFKTISLFEAKRIRFVHNYIGGGFIPI